MTKIDLSQSSLHQPSACTACGTLLDACDGPGTPSEGDYTVCVYCASINVFDDGLKLRAPTQEEITQIQADERYPYIREAINAVRKRRTSLQNIKLH